MKVSQLKLNPKNPRLIKDDKFRKLVRSIQEFPKMMSLRPIVIDDDNMVLGGNMRLRAIKELGMKEIPDDWVKKASELSDEEKRRFIIEDNVEFGEFDFDILANEWDEFELIDYGLNIPRTPQELENYENDNPTFPIVPAYDEKYNMVVIFIKTETDLQYIKNVLNLGKMKSYKNSASKETMVIDVEHLKKALND